MIVSDAFGDFAGAAASDTLHAGEVLGIGEGLVSHDGRTGFGLRSDGDLVHYDASGRIQWESYTSGSGGAVLVMGTDGDLTLRDARGAIVWHTGTAGSGAVRLSVQDDANLVLYRADGHPVWALRGGARPPGLPGGVPEDPGGGSLLGTLLAFTFLSPGMALTVLNPSAAAKAAGQVLTGNLGGAAATAASAYTGIASKALGFSASPATPLAAPSAPAATPPPAPSVQPTDAIPVPLLLVAGVLILALVALKR